ncbi:hypothetical protein BN136_1616 [Cronobacter universalis NCTC 9529]|nr:hypothetical protein BN136_1616 [Cronobacter universalis NCTC 9529]
MLFSETPAAGENFIEIPVAGQLQAIFKSTVCGVVTLFSNWLTLIC